MNLKSWVLVASLASVLGATRVGSQTLIERNKNQDYSSQQQVQSSTISVPAVTLSQPHILTVSISRGYIDGTIELNGRVLHYLQDREIRVDLSPHLLRGRNTLKILGDYNPEQASVKVELAAPQSQVSQQMAGNGRLGQIIILEVQ
ncbi:MAG: hypothetical protein QNJ41_12585 [Xenococcaceae cyanobacterium MO_188.B32]|nr:hypothetical protein [Xenococcaceae cyanobacterium MO_188.B32]